MLCNSSSYNKFGVICLVDFDAATCQQYSHLSFSFSAYDAQTERGFSFVIYRTTKQRVYSIDWMKEADVATVIPPTGLWTIVLKPWVRHAGCLHLGFWSHIWWRVEPVTSEGWI